MQAELIDHIRDELSGFEPEYREGAWEEFERTRRSRRILPWRQVLSKAALLTIFLTLAWLRSSDVYQQSPGRSAVIQPEELRLSGSKLSATTKTRQRYQKISRSYTSSIPEDPELTPSGEEVAPTTSEEKVNTVAVPLSAGVVAASNRSNYRARNSEPFATDAGEPEKDKTGYRPKWKLALSVGEAIDSRSKSNVNFGIQLAYRFNDRLSINSGVQYAQLGGQKAIDPGPVSTFSGKRMTGATAGMAGVEVPLTLNYHISRRVYAGVGISGYAVTKLEQTQEFNEQKVVISDFTDANGITHQESRTVNEIYTENVAPERSQKDQLIGLYNFSVGIIQPINKKTSFTLEPYLKIPLKDFSAQNINLSQAGVKVKVEF